MDTLKTETFIASMDDIVAGRVKCPLAPEVIPNYMGINLCCVDRVEWKRIKEGQDDGNLVSLTIHFSVDN